LVGIGGGCGVLEDSLVAQQAVALGAGIACGGEEVPVARVVEDVVCIVVIAENVISLVLIVVLIVILISSCVEYVVGFVVVAVTGVVVKVVKKIVPPLVVVITKDVTPRSIVLIVTVVISVGKQVVVSVASWLVVGGCVPSQVVADQTASCDWHCVC
jgi:hypothetical protein